MADLSVTFSSLKRAVGRYLGLHVTEGSWTAGELQLVTDIISSGLRQFYFPPPLEGQEQPHEWSFLLLDTTLSLTSSTASYDLPADFGQVLRDVTYGSGVDQVPLAVVDYSEIRALRSRDAATGAPRYIAWHPKALGPTAIQAFEATVYPTPDASYTLSYTYRALPSDLDATNLYPIGGAVHADTILQSCLAIAEQHHDEQAGTQATLFQQALARSIQADSLVHAGRLDSYQHTTVTYGTWDWIAQEMGAWLSRRGDKRLNPNPKTWPQPVRQEIDALIQRGVQLFYMPGTSVLDRRHQAHRWSFLTPLTTLTTVEPYSTGTIAATDGVVTLTSGTWPSWAAEGELVVSGVTYTVNTRDDDDQLTLDDTTVDIDSGTSYSLVRNAYDLPSDFGGIDGPLTYQPGSSSFRTSIRIVSETDIRRMRQYGNYGNTAPSHAAIRVKTPAAATGTRWQILLFPNPDQQYILDYRYKALQSAISTTQYPLGGPEHSETILQACKSVAEGAQGAEHARYLEMLGSSIEIDQMNAPESLGILGDPEEMFDSGLSHRDWRRSAPITVNGSVY